MSKPLENYIIRIKSSIDQFDNEGVIREEDRDHIELMTRGSFTKKNGSYYISYKETQTIGFEGCTTTIKIAEDGSRVALLRFGPTASSSSSGTAAISATTRRRWAPSLWASPATASTAS